MGLLTAAGEALVPRRPTALLISVHAARTNVDYYPQTGSSDRGCRVTWEERRGMREMRREEEGGGDVVLLSHVAITRSTEPS